jgi:hypothetical protein
MAPMFTLRRTAVAGLIACFSATVLGRQYLSPRDVEALPSRPADARVSYGTAPQQFGDVRIPKGTVPFPWLS